MRTRQIATWLLLGVLGLALAAGVTLAASNLSGQRIGLSAEPLTAGNQLAAPVPPRATAAPTRAPTARAKTPKAKTPARRPPARTATPAPPVPARTPAAPAAPVPPVATDDHGGGSSGRGRGRGGGSDD